MSAAGSRSGSRNDPVRIFLKRLALAALIGLVVFGSWSVWGAWKKDQESAALNQQSQAALADLTSEQQNLQQNISSLQSERGREAALRQEYAVGKNGENLVIIVDSTTSIPAPPPPPSFVEKLKKAFSWW